MSGLVFELGQDQISPAIHRLAGDALGHKIAEATGAIILNLAQRAFDEPALRPSTWAARKPPKGKKVDDGHPLLILSGNLRAGIFTKVTGQNVEIGSSADYAAHQQFGSPKTSGRGSGVPARPFFPVDDGMLTERAEAQMAPAVQALVDEAAGA